jgi:hypothetical protein
MVKPVYPPTTSLRGYNKDIYEHVCMEAPMEGSVFVLSFLKAE